MEYGIRSGRLKMSQMIRSKPFEMLQISLIVMYCILIILIFGLTDSCADGLIINTIFYYIELVILFLFFIETTFHTVALGMLYLKDLWNIVDLIIIVISIVFVLLDLTAQGNAVEGLTKIRSLFRLLRIFLLIRRLNTLRVKREALQKRAIFKGTDFRQPLERVLDILNELREYNSLINNLIQ